MRIITVINVEEACQILAEHGMKIYPAHLRAGIDCGAYPFGVAVQMSKSRVYEIFRPLLLRWIDERSEERGGMKMNEIGNVEKWLFV